MNTKKNKGFYKNIIIDYIYCFFQSFTTTDGIWVLYLGFKGMTLTQIGLLEGIFHVVSLIFEVPTGVMADLLGRKKTIILGRILSILGSWFMIFSNEFLGFAISFICTAASFNLNSGSEEALVYDSLKQENKTHEYEKINGRMNVIMECSHGIAVFLGGILSEISFVYSYVTAVVVGIMALFSAFLFIEPLPSVEEKKMNNTDNMAGTENMDTADDVDNTENMESTNCVDNTNNFDVTNNVDNTKNVNSTLKKHISISVKILKNNRKVRRILLFFPVIATFAQIVYYYGQQHFADLFFNKIEISIIFLISGVAAALGALSSNIVSKILGKNMRYLIGILVCVGIFNCGSNKQILAVTAFLVVCYLSTLLCPVSSFALNVEVESNQRATILSVNGLMYSGAMILLFFLVGLLGDWIGLSVVFRGLGIMGILFSSTFLWIDNEENS